MVKSDICSRFILTDKTWPSGLGHRVESLFPCGSCLYKDKYLSLRLVRLCRKQAKAGPSEPGFLLWDLWKRFRFWP